LRFFAQLVVTLVAQTFNLGNQLLFFFQQRAQLLGVARFQQLRLFNGENSLWKTGKGYTKSGANSRAARDQGA